MPHKVGKKWKWGNVERDTKHALIAAIETNIADLQRRDGARTMKIPREKSEGDQE